MAAAAEVEHVLVDIDATQQRVYNQASVRVLRSGELVAVYNDERWPFHHDSGQTVLIRSRDGGRTWGTTSSSRRARRCAGRGS